MANIDSLKKEFNRSFLPDSLNPNTIADYHNYDPVTYEPLPGHPNYQEPITTLPAQIPQLNMPSMDNFNLVNEQTMNNKFTNPQNAQFLQNSPYTVDQPSFDPYSSFRDFNQRQLASNMSQSNAPEQGLTFGQKVKNFFGNPIEREEGEGLFANTGLGQEAIEGYNERMGQTDYDPFGDDIAAEERAAQQDLMDRYGTTDMDEIRQIAAEGYYGDLANNQMIDPETGSLIELPKAPPRPSMDIASDDEFYDEDINITETEDPNFDQTLTELEQFNKDLAMKDSKKRLDDIYSEVDRRGLLSADPVGDGITEDEEGRLVFPEDVDLLKDPEFDVDITEKELLADNMPNFNKAWRQIKRQDRRDKFEAGMENVKNKFKDWRKGQKDKRFDRYTEEGKAGGIALSEKDFIDRFGEKAGPTEYENYKDKRSNRFKDRRLDRFTDKGKLGGIKLDKKDFIRKFGEEEGSTKYEEYSKQWSDRTAKIAALLKGKEGEQGGLAAMFMALAGQPYQYQKMFDNQNRNYGFPYYDVNNQDVEE